MRQKQNNNNPLFYVYFDYEFFSNVLFALLFEEVSSKQTFKDIFFV